ncbi:hypothetical protein Hypma_000448 [Hypsizygus marmoreus]|uniref:CBM1 domain-containing protein n=1 Tax=Hypsizygus marmoreus TaxID=39966 RepID=A0A369JG05_HYPMA|nr:hypothetical protein Hypma_000448 [Hypsizygus marmoreus]
MKGFSSAILTILSASSLLGVVVDALTTPPVTITTSPSATATGGGTNSCWVYRTAVPRAGTAPIWAQCGGIGYSGATTCVDGTYCEALNPYWHQCLPISPGSTTSSSITSGTRTLCS